MSGDKTKVNFSYVIHVRTPKHCVFGFFIFILGTACWNEYILEVLPFTLLVGFVSNWFILTKGPNSLVKLCQ